MDCEFSFGSGSFPTILASGDLFGKFDFLCVLQVKIGTRNLLLNYTRCSIWAEWATKLREKYFFFISSG